MAMQLSISIRFFSVIQIFLGLCSIISQIMTLHYVAILQKYIYDRFYDSFLYFGIVGCGIWVGSVYVISGIVGVATSTLQKRALLISTVILTAICLPLSVFIAILSVYDAWYIVSSCGDPRCEDWPGFEIALATSVVIGLVGNFVLLVLVSIQTCCLPRENISTTPQIMTIHPSMMVDNHGNPITYINAYQPQQMNQNEIPVKQ